jgi:hypothetical protein
MTDGSGMRHFLTCEGSVGCGWFCEEERVVWWGFAVLVTYLGKTAVLGRECLRSHQASGLNNKREEAIRIFYVRVVCAAVISISCLCVLVPVSLWLP